MSYQIIILQNDESKGLEINVFREKTFNALLVCHENFSVHSFPATNKFLFNNVHSQPNDLEIWR